MSRIYDNITQTIGNTRLVRLSRAAKKPGSLADVVFSDIGVESDSLADLIPAPV